MSLSESQHILSRLYTDQVYRLSFLNGREAFYRTQQIIDPETIAFLNALKTEQLEFFAKGLYAKKYHEVMHQIPGTAFLLKSTIGKLFRDFSQTPRTYGIHKHHEEAQAFLHYVQKQGHSSFVRAILKFEESLITNFISPKKWNVLFLRFNPVAFMKALQSGQQPLIKKQITLIIFKNGKIHKIY